MHRAYRRRRAGLTGLEVVAVAAIIGLLAGAFRARGGRRGEAAEQTCLGNVKSICTAIRMYMGDHDGALPPRETRAEVLDYFSTARGGMLGDRARGKVGILMASCSVAQDANPYLKWPVILEPYLESRSVWRCPAARMEKSATFINGSSDWLGHLMECEGEWGNVSLGAGTFLCILDSYPPGWGGDVTDSLAQQRMPIPSFAPAGGAEGAEGVFRQSIAANKAAAGLAPEELGDPAAFVICADAGAQGDSFSTGTLAYPDICALECANEVCGWVDWEECSWAADCGLYNHAPNDGSFLRNPNLRTPYARHRGGVNLGFLDGHAAWFASEDLIAQSPSQGDPERGRLRGYGPNGPTSDCSFAEDNPGVPTLY